MCSGDSKLKSAETGSLTFTQSLQNIFRTQFGSQSAITNFLNNKITPQIENPQGFSAQTKAALQGRAADTTATQFSNAEKSLQAAQAARGDFGGQAKSGVNAQLDAQLRAAGAAQLSGQLGDIQLQDEQLKQENYWKGIGALSGVAQLQNPQSFAGLSNEGTNATAAVGQAYNASTFGSKFISPFMGGLGQGLGSALGGGMPRLGGGASKPPQ